MISVDANALHKKSSFPSGISLVNLTKSAVSLNGKCHFLCSDSLIKSKNTMLKSRLCDYSGAEAIAMSQGRGTIRATQDF